MHRLGQHFLKNKNVIQKTADALEIKSGETVVEIGPGHGELTSGLLKSGAKVFAIERDVKLAAILEKDLEGPNLKILDGDALKVLPKLISQDFGGYKLAGNVPYYITGFLFRTIGNLSKKPDLSVFMIQKEVAERLTARPPHMNRLAASIGFWANAEYLFSVPKKDFSPVPRVDSAVVRLETKPETGDGEAYYSLIKAVFKQPRKTIWNNLRDSGFKDVDKTLEEAGINRENRPQNLSVESLIGLSKILKNPA